jgi:hypothetical protein
MNCDRATTFYPRGERRTSPRRLADPSWWRLDAERACRLRWNIQTPVLTGYPGPKRAMSPSALRAMRAGRAAVQLPIGQAVEPAAVPPLMVEYLRLNFPTVLMELVLRDHRPLCVRNRQRPLSVDAFATYRTDVVLVSDDAFAAFLEESAPRRGAQVLPASAVSAAMRVLRTDERYPAFSPVITVRAADLVRSSMNGGRWSRVELAALDRDLVRRVNFADAREEIQAWAEFDQTIRIRHNRRADITDKFAAVHMGGFLP